ncbi:MAG: bacteriohemerythrin [Pseudanabaenaceae cyanobacterium]
MERFIWENVPKTGVASIDAQHRELVEGINDLADGIEEGQGTAAIKKILTFLQYYAEWHFEHEEGCAHRHHCQHMEAHHHAHEQFKIMVKELRQEYQQSGGSEEIAVKIHHLLADWLLQHIIKVDCPMGTYICQQKEHLPSRAN